MFLVKCVIPVPHIEALKVSIIFVVIFGVLKMKKIRVSHWRIPQQIRLLFRETVGVFLGHWNRGKVSHPTMKFTTVNNGADKNMESLDKSPHMTSLSFLWQISFAIEISMLPIVVTVMER